MPITECETMRGFWFELASNIAAEASAVHTLFLLHSAARPRSPFPEVQSYRAGSSLPTLGRREEKRSTPRRPSEPSSLQCDALNRFDKSTVN